MAHPSGIPFEWDLGGGFFRVYALRLVGWAHLAASKTRFPNLARRPVYEPWGPLFREFFLTHRAQPWIL